MNNSQTWMAKAEEADRNWWIVDAEGQRLGRLATQIATLLRGKTNLPSHLIWTMGTLLLLSIQTKLK